jgi:23S rRNA (pseudouridine1915-N3)-methyltransferase
MRLHFVWVGKIKWAPIRQMVQEYLGRIHKFARVEVTETRDRDDAGTDPKRIAEKEGDDILKRLSTDTFVVALDESGRELDSRGLADLILRQKETGVKQLTFVIGGFAGLSNAVKNRADFVLALSRLTLTHEMARLLLVEQVYRACTILHGLRYQK